MPKIVTIAGCPSPTSSATAVLQFIHKSLASAEITVDNVAIRNLPSEDLLLGRAFSASIQRSKALLQQADGIVITASICKATYNGCLKAFFDLLEEDSLHKKVILPVAIGSSSCGFSEVDHALRTVLNALGASQILEGIYLLERQVQLHDRQVSIEAIAQQRIADGIQKLVQEVKKPVASIFGPVPFSSALASGLIPAH